MRFLIAALALSALGFAPVARDANAPSLVNPPQPQSSVGQRPWAYGEKGLIFMGCHEHAVKYGVCSSSPHKNLV